MADFPSFQTLFTLARNEMLARNGQLSRAVIDREGSDANILVAAAAAAADETIAQLVNVTAGLYLDTAQGAALDRLLFDRYGLTRKVAASGVTSLVFSTTTPNPAAFTIPANTVVATTDGIQYQTVQPETFPLGSVGPIYAIARSVVSGVNQQVRPDTLTSIVGSINGSPTDLVVTNPLASTGAADAESDASFRERGRAFFTTVRRGTLRSIEQGALSVPGVIRATAYEILDLNGYPAKYVALAIADEYTDTLANLTTIPPTYSAQSLALAQTVFNALQDYRAAGIFVNVQVAQVILVAVQLSLSFTAGANIDLVATNARAAIVGVINGLSPGDDLAPATLLAELRKVNGLVITGNEIVSPPGVIVTNPLQVLRTTLSIVSAVNSSPGTPIGNYFNPDQVQVTGGA